MQLLETVSGLQRALVRQLLRFKLEPRVSSRKEPQDPDEPYALVGAPKKPRTPLRTLSAAAPLHFEEPRQ